MAEIRAEKFNKQGIIARELANLALAEIDEALAEVIPIRLDDDLPPEAA